LRRRKMAIGKEKKLELIKKFGKSDRDTGSCEVQVAILTARIKEITEHLKFHKKDKHSRLGLLKLVSRRKKLLNYLRRTDRPLFDKIISELQIKA
jgi:small subunit ribosomal protein S15